jgi:hypothetical protein
MGVMKVDFLGSSDRRFAGVLLALVAFVVAAPSKVQAGCTSHVRVPGQPGSLVNRLDPLIVGEAGRIQDGSATPATPAVPRPCSGPTCSGKSSPPALPSISETRYVEAWACLGLITRRLTLDSGFVTTPSSLVSPILSPDVIFHPPRATTPASCA